LGFDKQKPGVLSISLNTSNACRLKGGELQESGTADARIGLRPHAEAISDSSKTLKKGGEK